MQLAILNNKQSGKHSNLSTSRPYVTFKTSTRATKSKYWFIKVSQPSVLIRTQIILRKCKHTSTHTDNTTRSTYITAKNEGLASKLWKTYQYSLTQTPKQTGTLRKPSKHLNQLPRWIHHENSTDQPAENETLCRIPRYSRLPKGDNLTVHFKKI
jgi:hypothetical protein